MQAKLPTVLLSRKTHAYINYCSELSHFAMLTKK